MAEVASMIKSARKRQGMSVKDVVAKLHMYKIDISEKALYSWESGYRQPDVEAFIALCNIFGIESFPIIKNASSISDEALSMAKKYDTLDYYGKRMVNAVIAEEVVRLNAGQEVSGAEVKQTKVIPLLGNSFAAGVPEPDFGNMWTNYEVSSSSKAEFAIKINGDSMEPYLKDGDVAYGVKQKPQIGDVGAFLLDGEFLCKQYCQDSFGNVYLLSLNRERSDCDVTVMQSSGRSLMCFGKILLPQRAELPRG